SLHAGDNASDGQTNDGTGLVLSNAGSGTGTQSGSTSWSYSGSGVYSDPSASAGIAFFIPGSDVPTISASVTGVASAQGSITGTIGGSWTDTISSGGVSSPGSAAITLSASNDAWYAGSGSFI